MIEQIEKVLDEKVRPALAAHGGDVGIVDYSGGVLRVELLGHCSMCSAAHLTTEMLISQEVKAAFSEVKMVSLVQSTSEDMLEMARKILNHTL